MDKQILDYIASQRVGVLAVVTPEGGVHGATLHFAYSEEPVNFYLGTGGGSLKGRAILAGENVKASFVLGTDEETMKTFQADGEVSVVTGEEQVGFDEIYLGRFPGKAERAKGEGFLRVKFTPNWWRYTDMKNKVIINSN